MPVTETYAPSRTEITREVPAQFSIPGFETLPADRQATFLNIPSHLLEHARPVIEAEIAKSATLEEKESNLLAQKGAGENEREHATAREYQAAIAIETFHRAERGDPQAKKDLMDQKKELLGEDPSDEDIFKTILESESSNPFKQDMVMEILLTDREAETTQKVFDLFKKYRGDLASVDDALPATEQLEFFLALSKGQGSLNRRFDFVETVLDHITEKGTVNLFEALNNRKLIKDRRLIEPRLEETAENWQENIHDLVN